MSKRSTRYWRAMRTGWAYGPALELHLIPREALLDGAMFAYLEDVSPRGRITYVTEGIFPMANHKISTGPLPYFPFGLAHSFLRPDAQPLIPRQAAEIAFSLFPTSVVPRKGHSIRLALAGADASMFTRCLPEGLA
jgi:predicted acyl esterase